MVEYGWVASPVKAGLRPPPPATDGLDTACHPAIVCHQAFDCKERLRCTQGPCQLFSLRHLCADSDNHPQEGTRRALRVDDAVVDALLADIEAGGAKDALPLLAFTLERLYTPAGMEYLREMLAEYKRDRSSPRP